jgi:hypothetical protein
MMPQDDMNLILGGNAARIFNLEVPDTRLFKPHPTRWVAGPKNARRPGSIDRVSLPYKCSHSAQEEGDRCPIGELSAVPTT